MSIKGSKLLKFDCKVCEHCLRAMTSKQYWTHKCFAKPGEEAIQVAKKTETEDRLESLQEALENARYELDDLSLEEEVLQDKIREKEAEIADLEDRLAEAEEDADAE